jgi:hypothetical protein
MEVFIEIAENLADQHCFGTLANLNVACRQLLENTDPVLHRTLVLDKKDWLGPRWNDPEVFRREMAHRNFKNTK